MKLIKTKLAAALIFGTVMFSMVSFTTTRIAAQETSSTVSAVTVDDEKKLAQNAEKAVGKALGYIFYAAVVVAVVLVSSCFAERETEYPTDALD